MHSLQGWRKPGVQLSDRGGVSAQQPVEDGQRRPSRRLIHMHIGAVHRHRLLAHPPAYGSSHRPGRLSSWGISLRFRSGSAAPKSLRVNVLLAAMFRV